MFWAPVFAWHASCTIIIVVWACMAFACTYDAGLDLQEYSTCKTTVQQLRTIITNNQYIFIMITLVIIVVVL